MIAVDLREALESRAGASDTDRPSWLAERLDGITATEVRDLYLQGSGFRARLLREKAERFIGAELENQYVAWGRRREPVIAAWAQERFAIVPESRVFHAVDNHRLLASPDGIGVDFDGELVIDEIKTGKDDIAPGTEAFDRKGYQLQCIWGMRVTGARRCRYIWEQHDSDWQDRGGEFPEPAPLHAEPLSEWIEYDEQLAVELEAIAIDFLAELDEMVRDLADGVGPQIDDQLDTLAVNLLRFREMEAEGKKAKEGVWKDLQDRVAGCDPFSQESALARVTWSPGADTISEALDVEAAKAADPALFEELEAVSARWAAHQAGFVKSVVTPGRSTLTVTAVKPTKEKK